MQTALTIIGASYKPERYSYQLMQMAKQMGRNFHLVRPGIQEIEGNPVLSELNQAPKGTILTLYINANASSKLFQNIVENQPQKVIFNPGAENPELAKSLEESGIKTQNACSLVLMRTGQIDQ